MTFSEYSKLFLIEIEKKKNRIKLSVILIVEIKNKIQQNAKQ